MIGMGGLDFGSVWGWAKLLAVVAMTAAHMWMAARRKDFALGRNTRSGRSYRIANEVPTILMVVAVIAVHALGHPADMDALAKLCHAQGLPLIEDDQLRHRLWRS